VCGLMFGLICGFYLLSVIQPAGSATVSISVVLTAAMIVREIKENAYPCVM